MARILIADDDADIRELIAFKLGLDDHLIREVGDGEAALDAVRSFDPDLLVLDVMMPRLTGLEVCAALRSDPSTRALPILLLTARAQEADVEQGFATGVDDYLVKPFSPRELSSRVATLLSRFGPRGQPV